MMKAMVITPAFTHAHHALHLQVQRSGLPWLPLYEHSDLPRVRSVLIEEALRRGAERVILVDADTVPADGVLEGLARSPAVTPTRAVWGLYPLREGDRWSVRPEDPEAALEAIAARRPFAIVSGGLGLACVHRQSLERVGADLPSVEEDTGARWRPFCVPIVSELAQVDTDPPVRRARYYADDGSLCWRLRHYGTELWCDPTARAGHVVSRMVTEPSAL
jgi:hypothetical protein